MPQLEDDASATDLRKEMEEEKNRSDHNQNTWKSRVRVVPAQPEPGVGEDDPKNTTHRLEGRRAAEEGQTGTRTHIITEVKRGGREKVKREVQREGIRQEEYGGACRRQADRGHRSRGGRTPRA
jgi:hypothetical protein